MFRYYSNPAFSAVEPTRGSSNGGVRVTITGSGFDVFSGLAEQARCRWGAVHTTVPELLEPGRVVCRSAARPDLEAPNPNLTLTLTLTLS